MGRIGQLVGVGRSLATGGVLGVGHREPGRLRPLAESALDLPEADPSRAAEIDRMLAGADARALQARMVAGDLTAVELTAHLLSRALVTDRDVNAMIEMNPQALAEAREADARRAAGESGPLLGIPLTVKDNIETAGGLRTTGGAQILAEHRAAEPAPVVVALRRSGAVVLGTANLSELAGAVSRKPGYSAVGGLTHNPRGGAFPPGGSSSGSAAGVAAGLTVLSVGTETSGSLLAPAAFNGVVGMKPSRGVVDGAGIIPLVRHQDSAGPVARSVADAADLLATLSGGRVAASLVPDALSGVRVAVLADDIRSQRTPFEDTSDNPAVLDRIMAALRAADATAVEATILPDGALPAFEAAFVTVVLGGLTHDTLGYLARAGAPVATVADLQAYNLRDPRHRMPTGQFFLGLAVVRGISLAAYEDTALRLRQQASDILDATFDAAGCDLLASVSNRHSALYATAGYPAVTLPLGPRGNGMPVGLTLIGRAGRDAALLGMAAAIETSIATLATG